MAPQRNSESGPSSKSSSDPLIEKVEKPQLEFHFVTLFPEVFQPVLHSSLFGKALQNRLISFQTTQIRDFATNKHRTVDDAPYGGGEGMLLKADVLYDAWRSVVPEGTEDQAHTILLSPQGELFTQDLAKELAKYPKLVFVCGHYEGVDERFIELCVDREISIGDYVLTGGELPAMVIADTVARLVSGVIGNERSVTQDSLENGLLKYPQYTRPREFKGLEVPEVLMGGNHKSIADWRHQQMVERTARKRPDLLKSKK